MKTSITIIREIYFIFVQENTKVDFSLQKKMQPINRSSQLKN